MTLYIGDIPIHYVSSFNVDRGLKNIEEVHFIGSDVVPYLAEHNSKLLDLEISGTLLAESGISATLDDLAERILAIKDRGACFNFIHDFQSRSGWAGLKEGASDKNAHSLVTRPFNIEGKFLPKNSYQPRMHSHPIILTNDFSLNLGSDGCDNYIPIPIGATYSGGDGSTITRVGKDGTITLVKATTNNDIKWDLDADEVDIGECKVWDSVITNDTTEANWVRIFNLDHVFTGDTIIENGLVRLKYILGHHHVPYFYIYHTSAWNAVGSGAYLDIMIGGISTDLVIITKILTLTPDKIELENYQRRWNTTTWYKTNMILKSSMHLFEIYCDDAVDYIDLRYLNDRFAWGLDSGGVSLRDADLGISGNIILTDNYGVSFNDDDTEIVVSVTAKGDQFYNGSVDNKGITGNIDGCKCFFAAFPFTCANLFKECEDMTQGAGVAFYTGVDASPKTGNTGSILNAQNENIYYEFTGGTNLPLGTYKLFLRAKDSAQVTDDISCLVRNTTDSTDVMAETTKTLTGSWAYYSFDVTIASDDDTDTIRVTLNKETATANIIDLDYVLWVPISLASGNGPQDIAHQAMVDQRMQREIVQR